MFWREADPMLSARAAAAHFSDGQKMYVAGGIGGDGAPVDSVEVYEGGAWSAKARLPSATSG